MNTRTSATPFPKDRSSPSLLEMLLISSYNRAANKILIKNFYIIAVVHFTFEIGTPKNHKTVKVVLPI